MAWDYFAFVRALRTSDLPAVDRQVLSAIALRCDLVGECYPSYALIAADTALCSRTVQRSVLRLLAGPWLSAEQRHGRTHAYRCHCVVGCGHRVTPDTESPLTQSPGGYDTESGVGTTQSPGGYDTESYDQPIDPPNDQPSQQQQQVADAGFPPGRPAHPRQQGYSGDLLNPEAEKIHQLLLRERLGVDNPVSFANYLSGKLGIMGRNALTIARVEMMVEKVAADAAGVAAANGGAGPSSSELAKHCEAWLCKPNSWWCKIEAAREAELNSSATAQVQESPPYHLEFPPEPPRKIVPCPPGFAESIMRIGNGGV